MIGKDITVDVKTLSGWLKEKKSVTLLDIRPLPEREEWLIPGSVHADVYVKLKANDPHAFNDVKLQKNFPIVAFCGGGKTSLIAVEMLRQKGYEAYSLDGGMKAWNYAWNSADEILGSGTRIIQIRRSSKGCLSYMIGSGTEALVVDAALDPEVYLQLAQDNGWTIKYVTDTHVHADYISRTRELAAASGATHIMIDQAIVEYSFSPVTDKEIIRIGNSSLQFLHTPGHTWESVTLQVDGRALITGDTLFVDGVGRPDLKANQEEAVKKSKQLHLSLRHLLESDPSTLVLPAHTSKAVPFDNKMIKATIGEVNDKLAFLKLDENEFVKYTLSRIPPTPPNYLTIAGLNKKGSYEGYIPADLEAGANRCAVG